MNEFKITSQELELSFEFKVLKYEDRVIDIQIVSMLRDLEFTDRYFDWFSEDILEFLEKNGLKRRWDIGTIKLHNIEALKLSDEELKTFTFQFRGVTNWDLEVSDENSTK